MAGRPVLNFAATAALAGWLCPSPAGPVAEMQGRIDGSLTARGGSHERSAGGPRRLGGHQLDPEPQIENFDSIDLTGQGVELRFRALAGNIYSVWYRDALSVSGWQTLTNVISKLTDADAIVTDPIVKDSRFYQLAITGQVD